VIWQLARHEWRRARASLLFWLLLALGQLVVAWLVFAQIEGFARIGPQLAASGSRLSATDLVVAPTLGSLVLVLLISVPLMAQGGFAGEQRSGRLALWLSVPVSSAQLVMGRTLGLFLSVLPLLFSAAATLAATGLGIELDWPRLVLGLAALLLFGLWLSCVMVALSTLAEHPAAVLALGYGTLLFVWLLDSFVEPDTSLHWAALLPHLQPAFDGLLRSSDIMFFLSTGLAAIGFAVYRIARRRGEI
jgi:ABC-2 type transport system permease protein